MRNQSNCDVADSCEDLQSSHELDSNYSQKQLKLNSDAETSLRHRKGKIIACAKETFDNGERTEELCKLVVLT